MAAAAMQRERGGGGGGGAPVSANERDFVVAALREEQRVDGRRPFDARALDVAFGRADGKAEVRLGATRVLAVATAELAAPFPDRPAEGTLALFAELSPMADPAFEPGRPTAAATELARVVDRGLRESRALDTEALCVAVGRSVWAIRLDLHVLDNGGNLVDAANIAALAALLSFRRPECSLGGEDDQSVIVHAPEDRDPIPLTLHHLPVAVTFAFFGDEGDLIVLDPSIKEEAVAGARLTLSLNTQGEVCAVQKAGGAGVPPAQVLRCMRIAAGRATDIAAQLRKQVEALDVARAQRKVRRHAPAPRSAGKGDGVPDMDAEGITEGICDK